MRIYNLHIVFVSLSFLCFFSCLDVQAQRTSRASILSKQVEDMPTGIEQLALNKRKLRRLLVLIGSVDRSYSPVRLFRSLTFLKSMSIPSDARVRLVLMIAAAERTARFMKVALLKSLDIIDAHIIYWRSMGNRSISYNLHKSPFKLFTGKSQYREIGDNLKRLKKLEKKYFILLGHVNDQLNRFNSDAVFEQQLSWVCELVKIMQKMPFIKGKREVKSTLGGVMNCLQDILCRLPRYRDKLAYEIGESAMPGYFTVKNTLIVSTVLGVSWYLYKHPSVLGSAVFKASAACDSFYTDNIKGPLMRIKTALFGGVGKEKEVDDIAGKFKGIIDKALRARIDGPGDGEGEEGEGAIGSSASAAAGDEHAVLGPRFEDAYVRVVRDYFRDMPEARATELARERNLEPLKQIIRDIAGNFSQLNRVEREDLHWTVSWLVAQTKEGESTQVKAIETLVRVFLIAADTVGLRAKELGEDATEPMKELIDVAQRVIDQSQLTAAILALIPTGLAAWAGFSLVKKLAILLFGREIYNFRFTRFVLHDLHHLLNVNADKFMDEMDFESQGKLLFYVHQLKRDTYDHVRYDQVHRFLSDVRALSSTKLSTTQKLESIHGIWNTYTFLKAGHRSKKA